MTSREKIKKIIEKNYNKYLQISINIKCNPTNLSFENEYEVLNECLLYLIEKTKKHDKIIEYLDFYLIQMLKYSYRSKSSKYQQKYNKIEYVCLGSIGREADIEQFSNSIIRKSEKNIIYNTFDDDSSFDSEQLIKILKEEKINLVEEKIKKLDWYEQELLHTFYYTKHNNLRKISELTGIPISSVRNNLINIYKKLK